MTLMTCMSLKKMKTHYQRLKLVRNLALLENKLHIGNLILLTLLLQDEKDKIYRQGSRSGSYYKALKSKTKSALYFHCKTNERRKKALIQECYDPKFPEIDLEARSLEKCFPPGHNREKSRQNQESAGQSSGSSKNKRLGGQYYTLNNGMTIKFSRHHRPYCPTNEKVSKIYVFNFGESFLSSKNSILTYICPAINLTDF